MTQDMYGFRHSRGRGGIDAFVQATHAVLSCRPDGADALARAVAADAMHVAAHGLIGMSQIMQVRADLLARAREARAAAGTAAAWGSSADEAALIEALDLALAGRLAAAADRLDHAADRRHPSVLLVKLANMLRFQLGDPVGMARGTAAALGALPADAPGRGYILGCHAFALEEVGDYAVGERLGRAALDIVPDDGWAVHAVAHTFEMRGRPHDGIAWMEAQRPVWKQCGGFGFHSAWHLALFHLDLGAHDRVLELYDVDIRPTPAMEVRDVANGVSLLCRLRQHGVDVGSRWAELAAIARQRQQDTSLIFFTLHNLLAVLAVGEWTAARAMVRAIDEEAAGDWDQSDVAGEIGRPLAHALLALARGTDVGPMLGALARGLQPLGGSGAQRDLFVRLLAAGAAEAADAAAVCSIFAARRAVRPVDRFDRMLSAESPALR